MQKTKHWKKKVIDKLETTGHMKGYTRYQYMMEPYTIDVSIGSKQGFAGSNQVNAFSRWYGGWLLDTPKNFKTRKTVNAFVKKAKAQLEKGYEGKKVPFPN